ncbi:hypothetical protein [Rhizobium leguminosarum]|uniref:hypothetical protein n=1 Tax=Rhizobium leguminosarum TaxID=384 RepID=UPI0024B3A19C|nr:hypothetical protein [Rhizobium leguminosarum]WHO77449.1 hypothetical protein QMO81_000077 [Rhizobium leguminosarum]
MWKTLVLSLTLVPAAVSAEPVNMAGMGLMRCGDVIAAFIVDQQMAFEIFQWATGYMSGLNSALVVEMGKYRDLGSTVTNGNAGGFMRPLLAKCAQTPDTQLARLVDQYFRQLPVRNWPKN